MAKKVKPLSPEALKRKWDNYAVMEYAVMTARQIGLEEGRAEARARVIAEGIEEGRVLGKAEGIEEGRVLGKAEAIRAFQIRTAFEFRKLGIDDAKIAEILQMDVEELKLL